MTATNSGCAYSTENHVSDADPFADKPPRLVMAINRVQIEPNRTLPDASPGASVPDAAKITQADGATYLTDVLQWVKDGLDKSLDDAWATDAGKKGEFDDTDEEQAWAKRVAELFTGAAYGGPDIAADFIAFGAGDPAKPARIRPLQPTAYIYQRFQKSYVARDEYCTKVKFSDMATTENTDPAYSLFIACQHLSTLTLLARGFTVEADMLGVGLAAGRNKQHPIFSDGRGGAWHDWKGEHAEKPLLTEFAIGTLKLGPGSVYCYDPYGALKSRVFHLVDSDFEHDEDGKVKYEKDKVTGESVPVVSAKRRTELWQKDAEMAKTFAGDRDSPDAPQYAGPSYIEDYQRDGDGNPIPRTAVKLDKIQADGSHIWGVLRVEKAKNRLQAFDTSGSKWINQKEDVPFVDDPKVTVPALAATTSVGMFEGDWAKEVYRGNHYVGLGIPPAAPDLAGLTEHMTKARPVGLARLVVTRRIDTFNRPDTSDILFVSQYMRMWGDGDTDNWSPARFMMSLRNTPYYKDLRCFWFLYAPRGKLAELMWKEGARSRSVADLFKEVLAFHADYNASHKGDAKFQKKPETQLYLGSHLMCASVISHDANGLAHTAWRNRIAGSNGSVPRTLKRYFLDPTPDNMTSDGKLAKLGCAWDGEYVHAAIEDAGGKVSVPEPIGTPEEPGPSPAVSNDEEAAQ